MLGLPNIQPKYLLFVIEELGLRSKKRKDVESQSVDF